jgi:mevalonate kinase
MDTNHLVLQALGVSTPRLDRLVGAARGAGALGAKLSGAGGGGIMVALVRDETAEVVTAALRESGARSVFATRVQAT